MKIKKILSIGLIPFCLTGCSSRFTPSYNLFSTFVSMSFTCSNKKVSGTICDSIKESLTEINDLSDAYKTKSIRNLATVNNSSSALKVDKKLVDMVDIALSYQSSTNDYYNPFNKKINDLYKNAYANKQEPTQEEIDALLTENTNSSVIVDKTENSIEVIGEADLDIAPIARGYALKELRTLFADSGVANYIVSIGSTCLTMTHTKNGAGFNVYIPDTEKGDYVVLKDTSVAICSDFYNSQSASYVFNVNPKDGTRNYTYDKVVVVGEDPILCSVMAMVGMFMEENEIKNLEQTNHLKFLTYKKQDIKYSSLEVKSQVNKK